MAHIRCSTSAQYAVRELPLDPAIQKIIRSSLGRPMPTLANETALKENYRCEGGNSRLGVKHSQSPAHECSTRAQALRPGIRSDQVQS